MTVDEVNVVKELSDKEMTDKLCEMMGVTKPYLIRILEAIIELNNNAFKFANLCDNIDIEIGAKSRNILDTEKVTRALCALVMSYDNFADKIAEIKNKITSDALENAREATPEELAELTGGN
jgi:hypothetical protein